MSRNGDGDALRTCANCGRSWFRLRDDDLPGGAGAVCIDETGLITGYSGGFECARCGAALNDLPVSGQVQLRLVQ